MHNILERLFRLQEKGTSVKTELLAGVTTFIALAYIMFINPNILADAGIPKEAASAATKSSCKRTDSSALKLSSVNK